MCIAIWKPQNKVLTEEVLSNCWKNNSDGAGFMYNVNGVLKVKKGFFTFPEFYKSYKDSIGNQQAVVHFRIKTHGEINKENCHPFKVNDNLAFVHNGIISSVDDSDNKSMNDTWHFNEKIIKPLINKYKDIIETDALQILISDFIGGSKLIFMDKNDKVWIFNEKKGEYVDGIWFSNSSYKERKVVTYNYKSKYKPNQHYTPPPLPPQEKWQTPKTIFKTGDWVKLCKQWNHHKQGTLAIITSINGDYTANVEFLDDMTYETASYGRIALYFLEHEEKQVLQESEFSNFYN